MTRCSTVRRGSRNRRGAAIYLLVVGCGLLVSVLGLAGLTLVRVRARGGETVSDMTAARWNARSAVHLAMTRLAADAAWRSNMVNGVYTSPTAINSGVNTLSWSIADSDGSLTNIDQLLRVTGVGRSGVAVQSLAVQVRASQQVGPQTLRSMSSMAGVSTDDVRDDKRWCQYLKPTLPSGARAWWVTSVSLGCRRANSNLPVQVQISEPVGNMPSANIYQSVSVNSSTLSTSWIAQSFSFSNPKVLSVGDGICLAVTSTATTPPIQVAYRGGGMSEANSALVRGNKTSWNSPESDKALLYEVRGVYIVDLPDPTVIAGTWTWEAAP